MARKVILIADPGIDTAFAIALAMNDPNLEVVGLIPCAGNVSAEQATANVMILIAQLDPDKWPRTAAALPVKYAIDGTALHGPGGLGGVSFPVSTKNQYPTADKALVELVRQYPREVSIICLGPMTTLAAAFVRDPDLPAQIDKCVLIGGTHREPGNAGPMSEFHLAVDPDAARKVLSAGMNPTLIPLDVTRKLVLSPTELLELPNPESRTCQFLRQVVPYGIRASSNLYGIEGFHLKDVLAVAALALPGSVSCEPKNVDVETRGELTMGMLVVDDRKSPTSAPNVMLAAGAAVGEIRQWMAHTLKNAP
ncbi:nucleoside hydrolase [Limnoglobus roseus]|uniref:Nucleoside hydrolase n=1 Tax=Limnoglobus roseus TaxID=2598579 RepID=A0A5C1AHH5_9BACT|nr:nucleoside hydrolase [Limnoglobus roseus]QEL18280.1 nucleoside hydrolase [Limnoglobus roseus]